MKETLRSVLKLTPAPVAFFLLGAYSITTQILLIREFLVVFFGNELCMGIIFAAWLFAIFVGTIIGGQVAPHNRRTLFSFILLQYLLVLLPVFQIILIRSLRHFLHIPPGEYIPFLSMLGSIFLILFPFSFFIGFIFPFAVSISPRLAASPSRGIGTVYIYESLGSALGGAALTFYFITCCSPLQITVFFILLILLNALMLTLQIKEKVFQFFLIVLWGIFGFGFAGLSYFTFWDHLENLTVLKRWQSISPRIDLVESVNSSYQNIVVAKVADQYSIYGNGHILTSFPDPFSSAVKAHLILTEHPHPEKVLLIGGGISGLLKEILQHPVKTLHYVELDPKLIAIGKKYLPADDRMVFRDPRVTAFLNDGRYYVQGCREQYDVVILNLPDPSTALLNRFYTLNFFREIHKILKPDGLLVTGVTSSENFIGQKIGNYTASVYHSLAEVFSSLLVTPGDYNYFFASPTPGITTTNTAILAQRYLDRKIHTPYFSPYHFKLLLPPERVTFINSAIKKVHVPYPNTDERPISYFYNLILWNVFSGGKGEGFFQVVERLSWRSFFLPLVVFVFLRFMYVRRVKKFSLPQEVTFNSLYAIFATGFAAMGLEIILIFAYQNHYGCLYQKVGLIIALFMAGLAAGAQNMNRMIKKSSFNRQKILLGLEILLTFFSFSLPGALMVVFQYTEGIGFSESIFMIFVFSAGILSGLGFPLVNEILIQQGRSAGEAAGKVNGYDHLGACLGGALTGTVLVPLVGILQSCFFIASLNFIACLFLIACRSRKKALPVP